MPSIREQQALLPVDYFHSKVAYRWDNFVHDTSVRVCGTISLVFCCIGFAIWFFIGFNEADGLPIPFLGISFGCMLLSIMCGTIGFTFYDIKELGFEGNLIMLNKIIKLRPSFESIDKWSEIALDINNYVNEKNILRCGYIFYDGNDCKSYFEYIVKEVHKHKKNKKKRKLREEETKHYNKFKKSISKGKHHNLNHNHHKYYCDVSTQTDKDKDKCNASRNNFSGSKFSRRNGTNNFNLNVDLGTNNNNYRNTDPLSLSSIHLQNKFLKKKFKKANKIYENASVKYWENKYK
mgnify:CR=1 FL=1